MTYANGVTASYGYDDAGRLLSLVNQIGAATVSTFSYTHDKVGNRTSMTDNDGTHNYLYDQLYRLIDATHPQPQNPAENFDYDPVENRTASAVSTAYAYDNMNRLLSEMTYQYDAENRLTQVAPLSSQINYQYDGMGRLVARTVNGVTTKYVYDEKDVLLELNENDQITARYTRTLAIDELISVDRDTTGDAVLDSTYYYHRDGLGSVTAMTDSGGAVVKGYIYDSFGDVKDEIGTVENRYTYTSRSWDQEAGLYYYRARFYDAGVGRFLSEDVRSGLELTSLLTTPQGLNLYNYVKGDPVNFVDPRGLFILPWAALPYILPYIEPYITDTPQVCNAAGICAPEGDIPEVELVPPRPRATQLCQIDIRIRRLGDIVIETFEQASGRDLTPAEIQTIQALYRRMEQFRSEHIRRTGREPWILPGVR